MNRREFFKGIATISLATLLGAAAPLRTPVEFKGKMLKPAPGGRILESADGGRNWQFNANFGPECSILELTPQDRELSLFPATPPTEVGLGVTIPMTTNEVAGRSTIQSRGVSCGHCPQRETCGAAAHARTSQTIPTTESREKSPR